MGYEEGQIILDSPTGAYYAGQDVNGRVVFELTKRKKVRGQYTKMLFEFTPDVSAIK